MKTVKTLLLCVAVSGILGLSACKKDKKTPTPAATGTVTATIDGTAMTFSKYTHVITGSVNDVNFTAVEGIAADGSTFTITLNGKLTAGEGFTSNDPDPGNAPELLYVQGDNNYMNGIDNPSITAKVTAISATNIQGTFSGTITEFKSGAPKVVTEGKFNVPIQQ